MSRRQTEARAEPGTIDQTLSFKKCSSCRHTQDKHNIMYAQISVRMYKHEPNSCISAQKESHTDRSCNGLRKEEYEIPHIEGFYYILLATNK